MTKKKKKKSKTIKQKQNNMYRKNLMTGIHIEQLYNIASSIHRESR